MSGIPLLAGVLGAWLLGACAGHQVEEPTSFEIYLREPPSEPARYQIQPGDELEVRFLHAPEQNVELVVRPDGFISLPLANEVRAAGRTPEEVRLDIVRAWEKEFRAPEVAVILRSATAYKIHVGGQVKSPGVFELAGERTVLQAIFEAGSFLPTATMANVLVIRPEGAGRFAVIPLDLAKVLDGSDTRQNIALRPYDAVFVPSSAIADINQWVDQYIRRNIPFSLGSTISLN
jgi:protein involved in polysaccharide export with SLBB domain